MIRKNFHLLMLLLVVLQSCASNEGVISTGPDIIEDSTATATKVLSETIATVQEPSITPTNQAYTVLLFTGVIVPARCVQADIDKHDSADYLFDEVRELISMVDIAVGTLNAAISDNAPRTGCIKTYVLVGGSGNADAMARAGFDVMSVATNHIKNCGAITCGDQAFFDTLDNLNRVGIVPVGAGENLEQAEKPVVIEANGIRFGFVSLGQIEPTAFAGENTPGIAVLNEESLRAAIQNARVVSDVVIAMPHWGPEEVAMPNWDQLTLARVAVDAGADLVVGNHTHVAQAYERIDGVPVFYGLGNFIFDQYWDRPLQQSIILLVRFEGSRFLDYQLVPVVSEAYGKVHMAGEEEAEEILKRLEQTNWNLPASVTPQPTIEGEEQ